MDTASMGEVRVLHVDDDPSFVELVADFLEREHAALSIRSATHVDDALSILHRESIECVVSDYEMPDRDGLDFLELVRDEMPEMPFLLFTGKGSEEIASRAISAGVTDYLQKAGGTDQYTVLANRVLNAVRTYRAETAVQRTEERYHNLVDTAPIPIVLFDEDGQTVYTNDAAVTFLDADSHAELQGRSLAEFVHPDDREAVRGRFERLMEDDVSVPEQEFRIRTVTGETKTAVVATAPGYYRGEKVAQAMAHD